MTDGTTTRSTYRPRTESAKACQQGEEDGKAAESNRDHDPDREHLGGLADGSGCTEIWEHLSDLRRADD